VAVSPCPPSLATRNPLGSVVISVAGAYNSEEGSGAPAAEDEEEEEEDERNFLAAGVLMKRLMMCVEGKREGG